MQAPERFRQEDGEEVGEQSDADVSEHQPEEPSVSRHLGSIRDSLRNLTSRVGQIRTLMPGVEMLRNFAGKLRVPRSSAVEPSWHNDGREEVAEEKVTDQEEGKAVTAMRAVIENAVERVTAWSMSQPHKPGRLRVHLHDVAHRLARRVGERISTRPEPSPTHPVRPVSGSKRRRIVRWLRRTRASDDEGPDVS